MTGATAVWSFAARGEACMAAGSSASSGRRLAYGLTGFVLV